MEIDTISALELINISQTYRKVAVEDYSRGRKCSKCIQEKAFTREGEVQLLSLGITYESSMIRKIINELETRYASDSVELKRELLNWYAVELDLTSFTPQAEKYAKKIIDTIFIMPEMDEYGHMTVKNKDHNVIFQDTFQPYSLCFTDQKTGDIIKLAEKVKVNAVNALNREITPQMSYYKAAYEKAGDMYINLASRKEREKYLKRKVTTQDVDELISSIEPENIPGTPIRMFSPKMREGRNLKPSKKLKSLPKTVVTLRRRLQPAGPTF